MGLIHKHFGTVIHVTQERFDQKWLPCPWATWPRCPDCAEWWHWKKWPRCQGCGFIDKGKHYDYSRNG